MEEIREIVKTIVDGCAHGGVIVKDVLAAFVARTVRNSLFFFEELMSFINLSI